MKLKLKEHERNYLLVRINRAQNNNNQILHQEKKDYDTLFPLYGKDDYLIILMEGIMEMRQDLEYVLNAVHRSIFDNPRSRFYPSLDIQKANDLNKKIIKAVLEA